MIIWAAFFLICNSDDCMTVGSPLFTNKADCENAVKSEGIFMIGNRWPEYKIVDWNCHSFGETEV
jgi:hypothetical protein|tara:strand:+ start:886 stop:1080 length:195 start_codon:yes stop_codon:yes gene_type:complete